MPISFTQEQKRKLTELLKKKGKEFFSKIGLKKTTIDDLAASIHISKGSFYTFFASKEELFFEIINDLERNYQPEIEKILDDPSLQPADALEQALLLQLNTVKESPILLSLFRLETIQQLMLKLPEQQLADHLNEHHEKWQKWFQKHKKDLAIKTSEIPAACEACDNIFYLLLHQPIEEMHKTTTMEILIKSFSRGLFKPEQENKNGHD